MFELMIFMFLFFIGSIAMFYYLIKRIDNIFNQLTDEHAQLRVLMRSLEAQLEQLEKTKPVDGDGHQRADGMATATDPLLHLSFEQSGLPEQQLANPELDINLDLNEK